MLERLSFIVAEDPVPKGRPRFGGGRAFTPARTVAYEKAVRAAAQEAMAAQGWVCSPGRFAVRLVIVSQDAKARDIDNLGKGSLDAINKVVYPDDSMVDALCVERWAPQSEGGYVFVSVERIPQALCPWSVGDPMLGWSRKFYELLDALD